MSALTVMVPLDEYNDLVRRANANTEANGKVNVALAEKVEALLEPTSYRLSPEAVIRGICTILRSSPLPLGEIEAPKPPIQSGP